jgi:hypothetical protein
MYNSEIRDAARRIVSKLESAQAGEAPRRMPESFIAEPSRWFVPEALQYVMPTDFGKVVLPGSKPVSPLAVRKEFRSIAEGGKWIPRFTLEGLGDRVSTHTRFGRIRARVLDHLRRIRLFFSRPGAVQAVARGMTKGRVRAGLGYTPTWVEEFLSEVEEDVSDIILNEQNAIAIDQQELNEVKQEVKTSGLSPETREEITAQIEALKKQLANAAEVVGEVVEVTKNEISKQTGGKIPPWLVLPAIFIGFKLLMR